MIAKSNKLCIYRHSDIVAKASDMMFKQIIKDDSIYDRYKDVVNLSSKLHDIGKLTMNFQKFLKGELKSPKYKYRHNEIGWAFLSKYLVSDFKDREYILNIVYWHHGITNKLASYTDSDVLKELDSESVSNMLTYLESIVGKENIDTSNYKDSVDAPSFYTKDEYILPMLRSIVISSDRLVSEITDIEYVDDSLINNYFNSENLYDSSIVSKFENTDRFNKQKDIATEAFLYNTTMIKAPAGFGKTMLGLLWGLKNNRKTIWVCPTNSITTSLYESITKELGNLNISNINIQLVLSSEIKKTNNGDRDIYDADIIVTNIDNFLAPSFKNSIMDSGSLLYSSNVIFDEFHVLIDDAPLMSLFVNIMRSRHKLTSSKTLLLSATPMLCTHLWDSGFNNITKILPDKNSHYPSVHSELYNINLVMDRTDIKEDNNMLVVENTIRNSQIAKSDSIYDMLLHSDFLDDVKEKKLYKLLNEHGKDNKCNKSNILGTHILQASLDISFNNLYETILSPESTIQRIGRINRWGMKNTSSNIYIFQKKDERMIKNILYNEELSNKWYTFISMYNNKSLTLDTLYTIYNDFTNKNRKEIEQYVTSRFDTSKRHLSKIYPIKINNTKKSNIKTSGTNKLRSVNNEIFYIIKHIDRDEWVGPFSKSLLQDFDKEFSEQSNTKRRMENTMKKLLNDSRFDYKEILGKKKYTTIDSIRRICNKSNTPYIVYDRVYDDELGIIKTKYLSK